MNILYSIERLRSILWLMFILVCNIALGQQQHGSISGTITTSDGNGAPYVNIAIKGTGKGVTTNTDGKFEIKRIAPGTYTLIASFIGFDPKEQTIEVRANENTTVSLSLNETSAQLDEVVVSGEREGYKVDAVSSSLRLQSSLLETPQNIQVVTKDVLKDQQIISMSDGLVRNVSGLVRNEHWGDLYTNITARGSQIQAFRNGFNVVSSFWGPLTEDMSFVDHVEFVKGPAGFMLANGDPSGLYNVVTKKPTGQTKGEASFTVGSYALYRATVDLDGKLSKDGKLLYRLNLSGQNKDSHRDYEYNDRYVIAPVISYQLTKKTKLTLEYNYQRANMSDVGSYYVFSQEGYGTLPVDFTTLSPKLPRTKINDHSVYLNAQHQFNSHWKITGQVARFVYDQDGTSLWPSSIDADGKMIRSIGIWQAKSEMTMGQLFVNGDFKTGVVGHKVLGGIDIADKDYMADWGQSHELDIAGSEFDVNDPYYGEPVNGYPDFDYSTSLEDRAKAAGGLMDQRYSGLYLQDELGFIDNKLRLTLAGRFTHVTQSEWGGDPKSAEHFTPRVGLSASIDKSTALYALYDQAFIPQSGKLAGGGEIKPITGNNMEVGVKREWMGGRWSSSLSVYRILKEHELVQDPDSDPTDGLSVELGQKQSQGIEFDIRGTIINGLNITANYAFTNSRVTKTAEGVTYDDGVTEIEVGDIVPGYAKHTVNTWLNYKIQNGALRGGGLSAGFTWLGDRATYWEAGPDKNEMLPNYFKVDAGMFWENDKVRVNVNVFNVLNDYLYSGSYYSWLNAYYWQTDAPRNIRVGVTYKF